MSTLLKIAVYFGSFDPIHVNHLSLCIDLIKREFNKVYIVPNQNNNLKPYVVAHHHRIAMINEMIIENNLEEKLEAYTSKIDQHSWEGRSKICSEISSKHENSQIYQIIGQDSYEKALERCQPPKGIYALEGRYLLIYPRNGCESSIKIPPSLNKLTIIADKYEEKVTCSSTFIRTQFMENKNYDELMKYVSLSVYNYAEKHHLYNCPKNQFKIIVILGPPDSGKGTLCQQLIKYYPKYKHISTGDLYRSDQERKTEEYLAIVEEKVKGYSQYMEALNRYIIKKLKTLIDPNKYYIIDGLKPTDLFSFESHVTSIDSIVTLNCHYKVAEERLKKRQKEENRQDDSDEAIRKRLSNYYHFLWMQKEILSSYQGTGRQVINLNCQKPASYLVKHNLWPTILKK